jgi:hypothetical protein
MLYLFKTNTFILKVENYFLMHIFLKIRFLINGLQACVDLF